MSEEKKKRKLGLVEVVAPNGEVVSQHEAAVGGFTEKTIGAVAPPLVSQSTWQGIVEAKRMTAGEAAAEISALPPADSGPIPYELPPEIASFEDQLRAQMKLPSKGELEKNKAKQAGFLAATPSTIGGMRMMPLAWLVESKTNPRRRFVAIDELAESFKRVGMLQPILARPLGDQKFEIVAGARRFRAAKVINLVEVLVDVRPLTDLQALEAQVVENVQRESFTPLEEAEGYEALVKQGYEVDTIAAKVAKSRGWVYARMKLLHLGPEGRSALLNGRVPLSAAYVLATYSHDLQAKGLKLIDSSEEGEIPARWAIEQLRTNLCRQLSAAPWKLNDAELDVNAGACTSCKFNSANDPVDLFAPVDKKRSTKGVCMKLDCYENKAKVHFARATAKAQAEGAMVLGPKEAKEVMPYGHLSFNAPFVEADAIVFNDAKKRSWRQILDDLPEDKRPKPTIVPDDTMKPVTLFDRKAATEAAASMGLKWAKAEAKSKALTAKDRARKKKNESSAELDRRTATRLARQVVDNALERTAPGLPELRALANLADRGAELAPELLTVFKIKGPVDEWIAKKAAPVELIAFMLATMGAKPWIEDSFGGVDESLLELAKAQGVDPKKVREAEQSAIEADAFMKWKQKGDDLEAKRGAIHYQIKQHKHGFAWAATKGKEAIAGIVCETLERAKADAMEHAQTMTKAVRS